MTDEMAYEKLKPIFDDLFEIDDLELTPNLTADDVPGWDSLNHIRLILSVQKAFNIKLSAIEVGDLENLGALVRLIVSKSPVI